MTMTETFRKGLIVRNPYTRISEDEIHAIDRASRKILEEIGFTCFSKEATGIFSEKGCSVVGRDDRSWTVKMPSSVLDDALKSVPSKVVLGARNPENALLLDAEVPRIYFGSGSETNVWLDTEVKTFVEKDSGKEMEMPVFEEKRGSVERLCTAAHLADKLDNLDFFIRPVNIQDDDITEDNHDVNKFYASLANITKHVQAGLTDMGQLDNVLRMAEIIAGGREAFKNNPVVSFITCTIKSPLVMVQDATAKMMEIARRNVPVVISSSPQGGTTAPVSEAGMVAQINAEILCGVALSQMVSPGAPVLYGSVPVRARMDNLHDLYGAPEFNQYNVDCIQMARFYKIPCYSTAGVGDAKAPGMQATVEKMFTHIPIAMSGAQYIHYAFGLLDRTNIFCPVQAVLDNQHIGMVKRFLATPEVTIADLDKALEQVQKVMSSDMGLYVRFVRKDLRSGKIYPGYPYDTEGIGGPIINAKQRMDDLLSTPVEKISSDMEGKIFDEIPGLVDRLRQN
jgi:trimethylamine--corrinoid protein Co-methyltransferase